METKIYKIILYISFLPYLLLLGYGIYSAIFGFTFFFSTSYGFDGFIGAITIMGIIFFAYYPVIPVCMVYQLIYFLRKKVLADMENKKFLILAIVLAIVLFVGIFMVFRSI